MRANPLLVIALVVVVGVAVAVLASLKEPARMPAPSPWPSATTPVAATPEPGPEPAIEDRWQGLPDDFFQEAKPGDFCATRGTVEWRNQEGLVDATHTTAIDTVSGEGSAVAIERIVSSAPIRDTIAPVTSARSVLAFGKTNGLGAFLALECKGVASVAVIESATVVFGKRVTCFRLEGTTARGSFVAWVAKRGRSTRVLAVSEKGSGKSPSGENANFRQERELVGYGTGDRLEVGTRDLATEWRKIDDTRFPWIDEDESLARLPLNTFARAELGQWVALRGKQSRKNKVMNMAYRVVDVWRVGEIEGDRVQARDDSFNDLASLNVDAPVVIYGRWRRSRAPSVLSLLRLSSSLDARITSDVSEAKNVGGHTFDCRKVHALVKGPYGECNVDLWQSSEVPVCGLVAFELVSITSEKDDDSRLSLEVAGFGPEKGKKTWGESEDSLKKDLGKAFTKK